MSQNYNLQVITGGIIANSLADIISAVSSAIGLYPGYTYQSTAIEQTASGDVLNIYYSDDNEQVQSEAVPLVVYAILAAISILGIAYLAYEIIPILPNSKLTGYVLLGSVAVISAAYFISSIKKRR